MMYSPFTATSNGMLLFVVLLMGTACTTNNNVYFCNASSSIVLVGSGSRYNLIPRGDTRNTQEGLTPTAATESPVLISFDGDLDAIREKALAKANNGSVTERPPSIFTCENETTTHLEIVNWIYSIETVAHADIETVFGEVSEITVDVVAPQTLSCFNNASSYANIVAIDGAIPGHESSTSETCQPELDPSNTCTIVIGRMRVFLSTKDTIQEATELVLQHIQESYDDPTFVDRVNSGIVNITFLSATDDNTGNTDENAPPPIEDEDDPDNDEVTEESDSRLGLSSILFVAMGSAALIVFVGSVYFYRRVRTNNNNDDEDGVHGSSASRFANMTVHDTATLEQNDKEENRPASPYSEMVSSSYRLDRLQEMSILSSSNMSPVYELEGNETDNDTVGGGASIMISEGGYTTDAGNTEDGDSTMFESTTVEGSKYSSSQSTPNVLGARPFPGTIGNFDMEEISDSDLDTSGEMSPVKMYVGDALTTQNKLLVLPSGQDPMDDESEDHDDSLLFGSPTPSKGLPPSFSGIDMVSSNATTVQATNNNNNNLSTAPTDEGGSGIYLSDSSHGMSGGGDVESAVGTMSATSPMSHNTAPSL